MSSPLSDFTRVIAGRWFNKNSLQSDYHAAGLVQQADAQFALMVSQNVAQERLVMYSGWPDNTVLLKAIPGYAYILYRIYGYTVPLGAGSTATGLYLTTKNTGNMVILEGNVATGLGDMHMYNDDLNYQMPENTALVLGGDGNNQGYSVLFYTRVRVG